MSSVSFKYYLSTSFVNLSITILSAPFTNSLIKPLCLTMIEDLFLLLSKSKNYNTSISISSPLILKTLPMFVV